MPAEQLTDRQKRAVEFIHAYGQKHGRAPSIREIGAHLGYPNPNNAQYLVSRLVELGHLNPKKVGGVPGRQRVLKVTDTFGMSIPMRGRVSCGQPKDADEDPNEKLDLRSMFGRTDLVAYRAVGDSMIDAHIMPGDHLIVKECAEPDAGQVVVAMVGERMLCKKFRKRRGKVRLEPCNGEHEAIDAEETEVRILGVLHTIIRQP